jgi:hypothetical protein
MSPRHAPHAAHPHDHGSHHAHSHSHSRSGEHGHDDARAFAGPARGSLLAMSASRRLGMAAGIVLLLWLAVFWAIAP